MSASDQELLGRYAGQGSEAAFRELVTRYVALVYSTAQRHLRDRAQSEDVAQLVFLRLSKAAPELGEKVRLAGWLYRTARHVSLTMARSRRREERRAWESVHLSMANGNDDTWQDAMEGALDPALAELEEEDREVLLLRYYRGKKFREVAESMGITEGAAKMRVGRALERLKGCLAERGVECPGTALGAMLGAVLVGQAPATLAASISSQVAAAGFRAGPGAVHGPAVGRIGKLVTQPALVLGLAAVMLTVIVGTGLVNLGPAESAAGATSGTQGGLLAGGGRRREVQAEVTGKALEARWSVEQRALWRALTAPMPVGAEMQRVGNTWMLGRISSTTPLSPEYLGRLLHLEEVREMVQRFGGDVQPALEVLREGLSHPDAFVREESLRALGVLKQGAEPLFDLVLALMVKGVFADLPADVLPNVLTGMAAPGLATERFLDLLQQGEFPSRQAVSVSMKMVLHQVPELVEVHLDRMVGMARADDLRVRLTGLGLVNSACARPGVLEELQREQPGLVALLPVAEVIANGRWFQESGRSMADEQKGGWVSEQAEFLRNAEQVLAGLDLDPAMTCGALREMLRYCGEKEGRDWIVRALAVLDPGVSEDPIAGKLVAQLRSLDQFKQDAAAGRLSAGELMAGMRDRERVSEASEALARMGAGARGCVAELISELGTWRDYFIFRALRDVEPVAMLEGLKSPGSAGEAAAALGELGAEGAWALPALHDAFKVASAENSNLIASAIRAIEVSGGP